MRILVGIISIASILSPHILFAALSCTTTTAVACTGGTNTIVVRMSGSANAHAELPNQSTAGYANNVICCSGVTGLGNNCSGTYAVVAKLSGVTNASIQQSNQSGYSDEICLSDSTSGDTVTIGYQSGSCAGYDTTVASISSVDNAHIGNSSAHSNKICASISQQALSFSISDNSIGLGALSTAAARYATGDLAGSSSETEAHQLVASTSSASGYVITVQGATLTSGGNSITAIGGTNTASSIGTPQFGLRMSAAGGLGTVSSPYSASGFAYAANATTASQVASASTGDSVETTYSVRYLGNISPTTVQGSYSTNLVYVMTANF